MSHHVTPEKITQLGLGFWESKTMLSAIELGVFTKLAGQALDAEGLRTELGLHPRAARDFFGELYADSARLETFLGGMTGLSRGASLVIARALPWSDYRTVCDVGAAQGDLLAQVALANPHLTCVGFDLPPVKPVFERYVAS